jgi:hypothetical protein
MWVYLLRGEESPGVPALDQHVREVRHARGVVQVVEGVVPVPHGQVVDEPAEGRGLDAQRVGDAQGVD